MHALVIEDDPLIAILIAEELRELGFRSVHTASTEEEAVISVAQRCPDLVTSDGHLAAGSGMGAVRMIRAFCCVPVICITGDPEGARGWMPGSPILEKPFTHAQFTSAVRKCGFGRETARTICKTQHWNRAGEAATHAP